MFSSKATTLAISASLVAVASAITINTPSALIQCQPTLLSWGDGVAPYYLAIIPGGQPSAAALENLPQQTGTSYTWLVDLAAGQSVTVRVTDSTGAINYSDKVTIQPGSSTNCAAGSGGSGAASSSSAAGGNVVVASSAAASSSGRQPLTSSAAAPLTFTSSMATLITPTAVTTTKAVSSGINNNAAASSSPAAATSSKPNSAATLKAATGLLIGALIFALAA